MTIFSSDNSADIVNNDLTSDELNLAKWNNLTEQEKINLVNELYSIANEYKSQRDRYSALVSEQQTLLDSMNDTINKNKPLKWGLSGGVGAGFLYNNTYNNLNVMLYAELDAHIIFLKHFMFSPGVMVNFYNDPGVSFKVSFGGLF